ncbi:MAG: L-threonylcarbamoyladenylate synthase [Candidatus Pacebacteria bacterium]|nr:L-threonylcarbamoyladenylate synthase [Candidatus Paceibacterota bacterium]
MENNWTTAEKILKKGGVGIIPTDTLYGLVGSAFSKKAISKIYRIKERDLNKPLIVLINSFDDLGLFGVKVEEKTTKLLEKIWPRKVSVILPCNLKKFEFIHRGTNSIAFRMIDKSNKDLFNLIKKVGPIVAPSANKESLPPAETIKEAKDYFIDEVDFYIDDGVKKSKASTLITFKDNKKIVLRK